MEVNLFIAFKHKFKCFCGNHYGPIFSRSYKHGYYNLYTCDCCNYSEERFEMFPRGCIS
jgi:hypothetical protein